MNTNKDNIDVFFQKNQKEFENVSIDNFHEKRFLIKLSRRFKKIINIFPYLVRVFIVTIIIFASSIWTWNEYIRKDRHEITLKQKIVNVITFKK